MLEFHLIAVAVLTEFSSRAIVSTCRTMMSCQSRLAQTRRRVGWLESSLCWLVQHICMLWPSHRNICCICIRVWKDVPFRKRRPPVPSLQWMKTHGNRGNCSFMTLFVPPSCWLTGGLSHRCVVLVAFKQILTATGLKMKLKYSGNLFVVPFSSTTCSNLYQGWAVSSHRCCFWAWNCWIA